jgi:hypothetical protein
MRVLAVIFGIILLLPGLCSLGFMVAFAGSSGVGSSPIVLLWLVCFAISFGGFLMIRNGLRGPRPPAPPNGPPTPGEK